MKPFAGQSLTHSANLFSESPAALVFAALALPAVQRTVKLVSIYWMGGSSYCSVGKCSAADIRGYVQAQATAVRTAGGAHHAFLVHLDGPFWDGCWPQTPGQTCTLTSSGAGAGHGGGGRGGTEDPPFVEAAEADDACFCDVKEWAVGGYGPEALDFAAGPAQAPALADGIFAESWVQGSLVGGAKTLLHAAHIDASSLLLINDVPNCDEHGSTHPCSSAKTDVRADDQQWFAALAAIGGPRGGGQMGWAVWDWNDGADANNYYGDARADGLNLTLKGELHRAQALAGGAP